MIQYGFVVCGMLIYRVPIAEEAYKVSNRRWKMEEGLNCGTSGDDSLNYNRIGARTSNENI